MMMASPGMLNVFLDIIIQVKDPKLGQILRVLQYHPEMIQISA